MKTESEHQTVLARKLALGRERTEEKPRSLLRALRLGIARAAYDSARLPVAVIGARQSLRQQEELSEVVAADQLCLLYSSADGHTAAVCVDAGSVSAIIQQLTTGQVMGGDVPPRRYTVTDAAMTAPLIEMALARARELVEDEQDRRCLADLVYVGHAENQGSFLLALEQERYRVCELTAEFAGGTRQGRLLLILPEPENLAPAGESDLAPVRRLDQASGVMRAELRAVVGNVRLTLSELGCLKEGDLFPLAGSRLDSTALMTIDQQKVAVGRLGQSGGLRAVRINEAQPGPEVAPTGKVVFEEHEPRKQEAGTDLVSSGLDGRHAGPDGEQQDPSTQGNPPPKGADRPSPQIQ